MGTRTKKFSFCGQWSLMNAEVLFKSTIAKESGGDYGPVSLDNHPTVGMQQSVSVNLCAF